MRRRRFGNTKVTLADAYELLAAAVGDPKHGWDDLRWAIEELGGDVKLAEALWAGDAHDIFAASDAVRAAPGTPEIRRRVGDSAGTAYFWQKQKFMGAGRDERLSKRSPYFWVHPPNGEWDSGSKRRSPSSRALLLYYDLLWMRSLQTPAECWAAVLTLLEANGVNKLAPDITGKRRVVERLQTPGSFEVDGYFQVRYEMPLEIKYEKRPQLPVAKILAEAEILREAMKVLEARGAELVTFDAHPVELVMPFAQRFDVLEGV